MSDGSDLCERCRSLSYDQMLITEYPSDKCQIYHENWKSVESAAANGCSLCSFFKTTRAQSKAKDGSNVDPDLNGPIRLQILPPKFRNNGIKAGTRLDVFVSGDEAPPNLRTVLEDRY